MQAGLRHQHGGNRRHPRRAWQREKLVAECRHTVATAALAEKMTASKWREGMEENLG